MHLRPWPSAESCQRRDGVSVLSEKSLVPVIIHLRQRVLLARHTGRLKVWGQSPWHMCTWSIAPCQLNVSAPGLIVLICASYHP